MNLLFFLTPKQDVLYIYEDFTLRQTLEKWSNQRYATIPVLKRNGEYVGSITEGDILWGMKNLHGLDLEASEDVPISSFPRRRDYKAVTVTTDMPTLLKAAIEQNFVPVVDDRNVFIGMVRRTVLLRELYDKYTTLPTDKRFKGSPTSSPLILSCPSIWACIRRVPSTYCGATSAADSRYPWCWAGPCTGNGAG